MSQDNSSIYLNDNLAGSVAGIELLDEVIEHGPDAQSRSSLQQLKLDIEADQRELKALIHRLGADR